MKSNADRTRLHKVCSINPKQVDRFRDRFTVAGAKDDSRDCDVMASALRTDMHCFRLLPHCCTGLVLRSSMIRQAEPSTRPCVREENHGLARCVPWLIACSIWRVPPSDLELCTTPNWSPKKPLANR
jgi:hypothetical protein